MKLPLAAPDVIIFNYLLPIFVGAEVMKPTGVEGTTFGIEDGRFVTAAHCLREGMKSGWMALGMTNGKREGLEHQCLGTGGCLRLRRLPKPMYQFPF